jgi:SAM-dependent methyltransferase
MGTADEGLQWQVGVWDTISDRYLREIDDRFTGVVQGCVERAALRPGEHVLDLGTGTGAVAVAAAQAVGPAGRVLGVDISPQMLALAERRVTAADLGNVHLRAGRAEEIPADDEAFDVLVASLSLMYVIDREAGARECARVLRPGGRLVAAVWAGADAADIVRFQQTAGSFAPPPPVPGVGPGALGDPRPFLAQLQAAGITAKVETATTTFTFDDFEQAWDVLAGVTTAQLDPERRQDAKQAVRDAMWPDPSQPRVFENGTHFLVGERTD